MLKSKSFMYVFFHYAIILSFVLFLPPISIEDQKSIIAIANATIDEYNPDSNDGGDSVLEIGYRILEKYGGSQRPEESYWISYIKFDLSDAPNSYDRVELKLEFIFIEATDFLEIYATSSLWSEYLITWNNAPSNGDLIAENYVSEEIVYSFNVADLIEEKSGFWSICLILNDSNWMLLASRQCYNEFNPPQIIYYYMTTVFPSIRDLGLTIILIITILGFVILYSYWKRKRELT
ncbi:MAG: DNRLRE domain-containing protein [Candidatus Odinarchaeota archaeon]